MSPNRAIRDEGLQLGILSLEDDEGVIHKYEISVSDFNIYQSAGINWLTLYAEAGRKVEPDNDENPHPFMELNIVLDEGQELIRSPGRRLRVESYDERLSNLTNLYWWTHRPFDGEILIEGFENEALNARIVGSADGDPVALWARFQPNSERKRSFS